MGIRCVNRVVKDEPVTVEAGVLSERWAPGRVVRRLKRVRYGEKIPVAVEDNYFTQELLCKVVILHRSFMNALPGARRARPRLRM